MILVRDVAGNDAGLQVRQRLWRSLEQRHVGCRRERLRVGGGIGRQEAVTRWRGKTFTRRPAGYDATNVAQAPSVQCGAKRRRRKVVVILGWMFGWEAAGVAHRRVCASGYPGSPCGTASFWNPLCGGVVSNSLSPLLGRSLGRWATFFGLEGAGFEAEPASE